MKAPTAPRAPRTPRGIAPSVAIALAACLAARNVRAEDPPPSAAATNPPPAANVAVTYELPSMCPPIGDFELAVQQRVPSARFAADGEAQRFRVAAWPDGAEWVGELAAEPAIDASSVRRVRGATCSDVVAALALIAALALDPTATGHVPPAGDAAPPAAPSALPPAPPPALPPPPPPVVAPAPAPMSLESVDTRARGRNGPVWSFSWGAGGVVAVGIAPGTLFGAGLSVDATPARDRLLTWLIRFSATALFPRSVGSPLAARFSGQFLSLEGCPFNFSLGTAVSILPCLGLEGGVLEATGIPQVRLSTTQGQSALFVAAVQPLRVVIHLGKMFSVEADGTLKEPFRHDSFGYSRPSVPVHTVPSVTGSFGLGLRMSLDFF